MFPEDLKKFVGKEVRIIFLSGRFCQGILKLKFIPMGAIEYFFCEGYAFMSDDVLELVIIKEE